MKMTKAEFATLVRAVQAVAPEHLNEQVLEDLVCDLHYVYVLANSFPEDELKKLEASGEEYFW